MKVVLSIALLLAVSTAAQAKLTPFDGTQERAAPAATASADTSAARASAEQQYFQAPAAEMTDQVKDQAGRCSVSTFVFTKVRLAQACY